MGIFGGDDVAVFIILLPLRLLCSCVRWCVYYSCYLTFCAGLFILHKLSSPCCVRGAQHKKMAFVIFVCLLSGETF